MKKTITALILLLLFNCAKQEKEIRFYPNDELFNEVDAEIIKLDSTQLNFKELTDSIGTFYDRFGKLVIEFGDGNIKKRVIPFVYDGGLIKFRNVLQITSDSILIDDGYSISELERILGRHYTNNGENPLYSESSRKALVEVTVDTSKTAKEIKLTLINLTRIFDSLKKKELRDSTDLQIFFSYFRQIKIPPPPPPRELKNEK